MMLTEMIMAAKCAGTKCIKTHFPGDLG